MLGVNLTIPIMLNMNALNKPVKSQRLSDCIKNKIQENAVLNILHSVYFTFKV